MTVKARKPFAVGAKVAVIRTEHGWHDGSLYGVVAERIQRKTGSYCYVVRGEDGGDYEVRHTRDMHARS